MGTSGCLPRCATYNFLVVVIAVSAVLDVVLVVAGLFAQQPGQLRTSHMEARFTALPVAVHASTRRRLARAAIVLANVTRLKTFGRNWKANYSVRTELF